MAGKKEKSPVEKSEESVKESKKQLNKKGDNKQKEKDGKGSKQILDDESKVSLRKQEREK